MQTICYLSHTQLIAFRLESSTSPSTSNRRERRGLELWIHELAEILRIQTHSGRIVEFGEVESNDNDEVREDEYGAFEVVALSFAVHVREEENAENNRDHVPLWEDQIYERGQWSGKGCEAGSELTERLMDNLGGIDIQVVYGAIEDYSRDLEE